MFLQLIDTVSTHIDYHLHHQYVHKINFNRFDSHTNLITNAKVNRAQKSSLIVFFIHHKWNNNQTLQNPKFWYLGLVARWKSFCVLQNTEIVEGCSILIPNSIEHESISIPQQFKQKPIFSHKNVHTKEREGGNI